MNFAIRPVDLSTNPTASRWSHDEVDIDLRWYVLLTEPSNEFKATRHLDRLGFDPFMPTEIRQTQYTVRTMFGVQRRMRSIERPIFPGYIFLPLPDFGYATHQRFDIGREAKQYGTSKYFGKIYDVPGVRPNGHCFLKVGGRHVTIDPADIEIMRNVEAALKNPILPGCPFRVGDKVKMADGPLCELVAVISKLDETGRIELLMDILGRKSKLFVNARQIRAV